MRHPQHFVLAESINYITHTPVRNFALGASPGMR
jgi:hypothetical protein